MQFKSIKVGREFIASATHYTKRSSRTATNNKTGTVHYFRQIEEVANVSYASDKLHLIITSFKTATQDVDNVTSKPYLKTAIVSAIYETFMQRDVPKEAVEKIVDAIYLLDNRV